MNSFAECELLAPAGDLERLETALRFGADAVYLGGPMMQLRAGKVGFSMQQLERAVAFAHGMRKKVYVTVNAFADNREIDALPEYTQALAQLGTDAVIVSDLGAISTIAHAVPGLEIHVSTQANTLNYAAARAYFDLGAKRVVLGREMSLEEIARMREKIDPTMEMEAFVHGAMCMAYSGRCMISAYLTGRSANRGDCAQSCRWTYHLMEEKRPNQFFPVEEDDKGTTILSSLDLCALPVLEQLRDAGVTSFKIEGRMKTAFYVAGVVRAYRYYMNGGDRETAMSELLTVSHRPYSTGFYEGELKHHTPDRGAYESTRTFVGVITACRDGEIEVEIKNRIFAGQLLEVLTPDRMNAVVDTTDMQDCNGKHLESAVVPETHVILKTAQKFNEGDMLRVVNNE